MCVCDSVCVRPYVQLAFGRLVVEQQPRAIVSVHSFNPVYEQERREFDVGVLSSHDDRLAVQVTLWLWLWLCVWPCVALCVAVCV